MRVTKDVGDGETYWVRLNNRQQYGLLAAPAGHRNHLLLTCFPFKIRKFLLSLCPSGPLQRLSSLPTHTTVGAITRIRLPVVMYCLQTAAQVVRGLNTHRQLFRHITDTNLMRHMKEH